MYDMWTVGDWPDIEASLLDEIRSNKMLTDSRIVVIDGYVIAQCLRGVTGWWTCSKANHNEESDFAIWEDTRQNRFKAKQLLGGGDVLIIECDLKPSAPRGTRFYGEELRQLARSVK